MSVQRMYELESVFGQIKNNRGFRRFLLRCLQKVSLEVGWLSLAHNLTKKHKMGEKVTGPGKNEYFARSGFLIFDSADRPFSTKKLLMGQSLSASHRKKPN